MRRGEICGLTWNDVDLDEKRLVVRRQLTTSGYKLVFADVKTDRGRRAIDLDDETVAVLRSWWAQQATERLVIGRGYRDTRGLVFTRPDGEPLHPNSVGKVFDARVRAAGLSRIRLHDLRHTHCAHLIACGTHVKLVADRLGHASAAFTLDRYGHLLPTLGSDAAAAVARLIDSPATTA